MLYLFFFFFLPRTDYTFKVRLNLEFPPPSPPPTLVEMENYAILLLSPSHLLVLVLGDLNKREAIRIHATSLSSKKFSSVQQYHLRNETLKGKIYVSVYRVVELWNHNLGHHVGSSTGKMRIVINYYYYNTVLLRNCSMGASCCVKKC